MNIPEWTKSRRKDLGLTQAQVAAKLGLNQAHVSQIESGKLKPDVVLMKKINEIFGAFDGSYVASVVDPSKKTMPDKAMEALKAYREAKENNFCLQISKNIYITADRNQYILHHNGHLSYFVDIKALLKYLLGAEVRTSAVTTVKEVVQKLDELYILINDKFDKYDPANIAVLPTDTDIEIDMDESNEGE